MSSEITPGKILELGLAFWGSKTLLSAVELGLFAELAKGPLAREEIEHKIGLHPRASRDFLDALVALGVLNREKDIYSNSPEANQFLDRKKSSYVGGILEMANARLYPFWGSLTEALKTGKPQNETKNDANAFEKLYSDPERMECFLGAMTGISLPAAKAIAEKFPWDNYKTFADVGCAQGATPAQIALHHAHVEGIGYDLPVVQPVFERYIRTHALSNRVRFQCGDFFKDPLPKVDVLVMGHILHDWNLEQKKMLLKKAWEALPAGGALIVYEALIDDERKTNAFGLMMSLNMLIETSGGFDYSGADCAEWMREVGFKSVRVEHLAGPDSMVIATK
jgi:SAM-dependent methyltransferase